VTLARLPECSEATAALPLPDLAAVDQLDREDLVGLLTELGALTARARARLALVAAPVPAPPADDYLTAEEVAQLLRAETSWVYRHARPLGGVKLDGILRFSRRRLDAYLARQQRLGG
jgi:hypothetical protein